MIYEIWSNYGSDTEHCYSVVTDPKTAERHYARAQENQFPDVKCLVFDPYTNEPFYELFND